MGFSSKIFEIQTEVDFERFALSTFQFQYKNNLVYKTYVDYLKRDVDSIKSLQDIPFMPISFFKSGEIKSFDGPAMAEFTSSGTTGKNTSKHCVKDLSIYEASFQKAFELNYGAIANYCILALLPSYLERKGSSLVYMAQKMIAQSKFEQSGFYLNNLDELAKLIEKNENEGIPTLLLGVSFALLDLCEQFDLKLENTIVMETGGMKGRRQEITREALQKKLKQNLGVSSIHSEYGMTELLSQAYSKQDGLYNAPPWMKIMIRDVTDPFSYVAAQRIGGINVIDLANYWSCSFIETEDLGKKNNDNFEVLGRFDKSQIRGCNLLVD